MSNCWFCETPQGEFRITLTRWLGRERAVLYYEQQSLGCFDTAEVALDSLLRGETYKPSCGLDVRRLPVPPSLSGWVFSARAQVTGG